MPKYVVIYIYILYYIGTTPNPPQRGASQNISASETAKITLRKRVKEEKYDLGLGDKVLLRTPQLSQGSDSWLGKWKCFENYS